MNEALIYSALMFFISLVVYSIGWLVGELFFYHSLYYQLYLILTVGATLITAFVLAAIGLIANNFD